MIKMRRRNPTYNPLDEVLFDDDAPSEQQHMKPPPEKTPLERFAFVAMITLLLIGAVSFGKWTVYTVTVTTSSPASLKSRNNLFQMTYNVSELCETATASIARAKSKIYFECGQRRLLEEYGVSISLDTIEVDLTSGAGSISATLCNSLRSRGEDCSIDDNNKFNASDLLLWIRFRSPETVFAVTAQAGDDCKSWHADFQLPASAESATYQIDIVTLWLYGHPTKAQWVSDSDLETKRNMVWTGTPYLVPKGPILYGEYMRDGRWMKCSDWCIIHRKCTHWTLNNGMNGFVTDTKKCQLFSNVTGSTKVNGGAQSGFVQTNERRVTYLGGLSIDSTDMSTKKVCRQLSGILGSPATVDIAGAMTQQKSNNDKESLLSSQLPWCSSRGLKSDQKKREEGFWARVSDVYPTMVDGIKKCHDACVKDPYRDKTACTPDDTLQGICSFNDITPIYSGWHTGALHTAEPPIKEVAWVERDCRYRIGNGDMFQQCLEDKQYDIIYIQNHDIFGDLLDRWHLGRANEWNRKTWTDGFVYQVGKDWLLPTNGDVFPNQLQQHYVNTNSSNPIKAVVVQHLWSLISPRLYQDHRFDESSFVKTVHEQITNWKNAVGEDWLSSDTVFVLILSPIVHEFFGDPFYTYEAIEYFNGIARSLYEAAGWKTLDGMAMSRARPDYRLPMAWWNANSHLGEKKAGSGVVFAMANALFNAICA